MSDTPDILVLGFGPVGAVASSLLALAGFSVLAVDRAPAPYDKPRAVALDHEALRLFDRIDVLDAVLPHTAPFPPSEHFGADGQLIRRVDMLPEPHPLGFTPTVVFRQPEVEAALRARAAALPGVEIALATEAVALSDDGRVRLQGPDGAAREIAARWVVACDGAGSFARRTLGIGLEDLGFDEPWLVVDLRVTPAGLAKLPANAAQFCEPARPVSYIVGVGDHRRFEIAINPGEDPAEMQRPETVRRLLARWLAPEDAELWRAAAYRFHALVAQEWRRGRVLLAGDAAHQQPPFLGQGLCQGLRDAANLAWKLEALRDGAPAALLDSYQAERAQHVRTLTTRIKAIGRQIAERDPAAARARDAALLAAGGGKAPVVTRQEVVPPIETGFLSPLPHPANGTLFPQPWLLQAGGWARMDRVLGGSWRVIAADGFEAEGALPLGEERDGVVASWFTRHAVAAAILRPDHHVWGVARDAAELATQRASLAATLGRAV